MSQNIRAEWCSPALLVHGSTWNVDGSGRATMSASETRANPSMADPSNPMPSSKAPSSSAGAMATDFRYPSTSVNHNRTKRMSRSSSVRSTNSFCRSITAGYAPAVKSVLRGDERLRYRSAAQIGRRGDRVDEEVHHRGVHAGVAVEDHRVLGAVEGDQR